MAVTRNHFNIIPAEFKPRFLGFRALFHLDWLLPNLLKINKLSLTSNTDYDILIVNYRPSNELFYSIVRMA